jgi:hypothetical protein
VVGAKLVFADNLYVYGPPDGPMTEDTRQRAQRMKGRVRIEMPNALLRAHADGRLRVAIGRGDYHGPRGTRSTVGENIMKPLLRDKRVRWLGSLDQPHTLNYLEDMARSLVTLGERDEADGQVWHLPAAEPLTGRPRAAVRGGRARPEDRGRLEPVITIGGLFNPLLRELNETLYQFERPFVSDAAKFQAAFGPFEPTPHRAAVSRTVRLVPAPVRRLTPGPGTRGATGLMRARSGAARTTRAARPALATRRHVESASSRRTGKSAASTWAAVAAETATGDARTDERVRARLIGAVAPQDRPAGGQARRHMDADHPR